MPLAPKLFLPREFNLATTHHSSWKPGALGPATHQQNQCPPPSLFPHMARFWIELYHVSIWLESLGPGPWHQLQRELGKRIFLISTLGKTCKVFKGDWLPEDLTGVVSHALMLVVGMCFNTSVFDIISLQEKSTHPSLSKQELIKIWILVKIRSLLKSHWCQYSLPSLELKICRQPFVHISIWACLVFPLLLLKCLFHIIFYIQFPLQCS